jgi:ATP-binding protein involved in chromosome partitioning
MSVNREAALGEISDILLADGRRLEKADLIRASC